MSKKVIIMIVAAVLLLTAVPSLAATPSKTTQDMTQIVSVVAQDGSLHNEIITIQQNPSEYAQITFQALADFIATNEPTVHFFPDNVGTAIHDMMPQGVDEHNLVMSEFTALNIGNHDFAHGTIACTIQFPTVYTDKNTAVAVLGYLDSTGAAVWVPLETQIVNGVVTVNIPDEVLTAAGQNAVLSILSI